MPGVVGGSTEGEEGGWMGHGSLRACVHVQAQGVLLGDTEQLRGFQLQAACSLFRDNALVHFWEETAAGSPLRGQFIARHVGRVGCLKMLGSEGVKSLAGDVFLNRAS